MSNIKIDSSKEILFIEDYLSKTSSLFLSKAFNDNLTLMPRGILAGPSREKNAHKISTYDPVIEYTGNENTDLAIDMVSLLCQSVSISISEYAKKDMVLKNIFYSVMRTGSSNYLHMDNFENDRVKGPILKDNSEDDYSSILYLNDDFTGGELYFPKQEISITPLAGSIAIFKGDDSKPHQVLPVLSGTRVSIAMFFWPRETAERVLVD